jgi:hypothetical protein
MSEFYISLAEIFVHKKLLPVSNSFKKTQIMQKI